MLKTRKRSEGDWWLPETPDRVVKGALFVSPGKQPRLQLLGRLWDVSHLGGMYRAAVIHGRTSEGADVTLIAGHEVTVSLGHNRKPSRSIVTAEAAFIGAQFHSQSDITFTGLSIRYTYLEAWAFPSNSLTAQPSQGWTHVAVTTQMPPVGAPALLSGMKISLDLMGAYPQTQSNRITVIQQSWIRIDCDGERSYSDLALLIRRIGNFLSLCVSRGVQPIEIQAYSARAQMEDMDGKGYEIPVQIYDTTFFSPRREESITEWQMLLSYQSIAKEFGSMLTSWLQHSERLESVMNVYFATLQRDVYIEHRFLNLAQAIESYHRIVHGGTYISTKEFRNTIYKQLKNCLPADVSPELRDSILDRLRWSHEYTLRTRLRELLEDNRDAVTKHILDWDRFVSEVVATRNYLTHLGEANTNVQATAKAMNELADYLQFLVEICLLRLTGLTSERIREVLNSDYRYHNAERWTRYHAPTQLSEC